MNHERAFLEAIREHPDDDAPRLIFADWLEEQGGAERTARAHFIRLQCRLASLPDDDDERDELEDEATDLLAEYEEQWTQPLQGIAEDWRFARGFVEHCTIQGEPFLKHAERLFDFTPLRSVHLYIPPRDVPHLAGCPQLAWVEALDFTRCHLNDRSLQQLLTSPYLERLSSLNLTSNEINTPGIQALIQSPVFAHLRRLDLTQIRGVGDRTIHLLAQASHAANLESLSVAGTNLTPNGLYELLNAEVLAHLRELNLAGIKSQETRPQALSRSLRELPLLGRLHSLNLSETGAILAQGLLPSGNLANLRILSLRNIPFGRDFASLLARSSHLGKLTTLDLRRSSLSDTGVQKIADVPHLASLTSLDLSSNNIRDAGSIAISSSPFLTRLRDLNLARNGIGGPGLKALAASANLKHVRTLRVAGNFVGAENVRAIVASTHLTNLRELDLLDARLEEDSARVLASAPNLARLRALLLKNNQLGDGGARAFAQSEHLQRLTHLDLSDNRIGKAGAEALAASPHRRRLRHLDLGGNAFTDTEENLLRQRFGDAVCF